MSDFNQFKVINSRLKKRFLLRKPNFSEASQQFLDLSQEFRELKVTIRLTKQMTINFNEYFSVLSSLPF